MGKRFGRNQKRRMRETVFMLSARNEKLEIARQHLEIARRMDRALMDDYARNISHFREFFREVSMLVGNASAASIETLKVNASFVPLRLPVKESDSAIFESQMEFMQFSSEILHALNVEVIRHRVAGQMIVDVELADKTVKLALSESALRNMPLPMLERRVCRAMTKQLLFELHRG